MIVLLAQLIGGAIGLSLGWLLVYYIPDRRHRRECLRQFNARIVSFNDYVARLDAELSGDHSKR